MSKEQFGRIGIISDTHGYLDVVDEIVERTALLDIDLWLHAGDYGDDARYMAEQVDVPVIAVRGNNDRQQPLEPKEQLIPYKDTYIYMIHGHQFYPYNRIQEIISLGRSMGARLCIAGHSHHHGLYDAGDCLFINPGSPALPRDKSGGTIAIATYENGYFKGEFLYLKDSQW
ncbi:MAG: metallophosphoesterase [Veillonella sp.]|uniref:metallophosphoesterase family protein n=1 Tax=Veillonella sp. TaxID=1926307 RepID=UPI0025E14674|nr:metallophosphoesterase [Veillonella sp.]MBS4912962.1 metallophosphoesterase [Veillonella sp.]